MARKNKAAVSLGRRGGKVRSAAKTAAVRANGAKGGRPRSCLECGVKFPPGSGVEADGYVLCSQDCADQVQRAADIIRGLDEQQAKEEQARKQKADLALDTAHVIRGLGSLDQWEQEQARKQKAARALKAALTS